LLRNVAIDANDDVIIAGTTAASLDLGKGGTTYVAGNDVFVAKLSGVDGTTTWSVGYGSTLTEVVNGLALDATGNPVISGYFGAPFSFGGNPGLPKVGPAGTSDGFVAKLSAAAGAPIWSVGFGTAADDAVGSVAIDQTTGDVFVVGTSNGPLDVGGGPFPDPSPNPLVFVSKRNGATGAHTWSTSFTVGGSIVIDGLTLDAPGNPVIGGHFGGGTLKLAGVTKPLVGTFDAFIGRFDKTSKAELGVQTFSGAGASVFMGALAVASKTGNLVVAGNFQPTVDMGSGITLTSSGGSDMFLGSLGPQ
jgi:hypothetical protein